MKTITSILLGACSIALQTLGFSDAAARFDPLRRIDSANHREIESTAAFTGLPTAIDHSI